MLYNCYFNPNKLIISSMLILQLIFEFTFYAIWLYLLYALTLPQLVAHLIDVEVQQQIVLQLGRIYQKYLEADWQNK